MNEGGRIENDSRLDNLWIRIQVSILMHMNLVVFANHSIQKSIDEIHLFAMHRSLSLTNAITILQCKWFFR